MFEIPLLKDFIGKISKPRTVHDSIDYMNYFVSASLLAFFALFTSGLQYIGRPIKCWVPNEFSTAWEKYADDYCFIQSTYYIPFSEEISNERSGHISYYRWVPVVLGIQALCFMLPNELWNAFIKKMAFDPKVIVTEARKLHNGTLSKRKEDIDNLADLVEDALHCYVERRPREFRLGDWTIVLLYFVVKILYLANVIMQLFLLDKFLGNNDLFWGFQLISNLSQGRDWQSSSLFPRVILCDFQVREMGNIRQHTVQCVISMNLLNEKVYLVLWCWFLLVAFCTAINLLIFTGNFFIPSCRRHLVLDYLARERSDYSKEELERFVDGHIGPNGVLLLTFVGNHAGARVIRDLIARLFTVYTIGQLSTSKNFQRHELSFRGEHATISEQSSSVSGALKRSANPLIKVHGLDMKSCFCRSEYVPKLVANQKSSLPM
uniref:Innexin n=1 Tax=Plectus sambesii TaxID=2011161 RepID=A0A914V4P9_9BILA